MNRPLNPLTVLLVIAVLAVPSVAAISPGSDGTGEFISYYDQLDANRRAVYDAVNSAGTDILSVTVDLPVKLTFSSYDSDDAKLFAVNAARSIADDVFDVLRLVSPLAYWGWGLTVSDHTANIEVMNNDVSLISLTVTVNLSGYPADPDTDGSETVQKMLDEIKSAVDGFSTESTSTRDKVRDINNYITNLVTYDPNAGDTGGSLYSHDAYGALGDPSHYAVCDGYSKAFLLLCEKEGIECVVVLGTAIPSMVNHAWNYVKMDNGLWYAMDVTWNDDSDNAYFLMGGKSFFVSHQQGVYLEYGLIPHPFASPPISDSDYESSGMGYQQYEWILAVAIVVLMSVALYMHARGKN
ncbi:MAG: hypothetical protein LBJ20_04090 [Candidatus Methanoplasma sp.]|jgi:transglutaminase-like putative cysteine protease|nr:hypothetical protein [Candidatus Methanoplasma sp.]